MKNTKLLFWRNESVAVHLVTIRYQVDKIRQKQKNKKTKKTKKKNKKKKEAY